MTPSTDELLNYGFIRTRDSGPGQTATVIIVGLPRSGTSMIASVMKALGIFIGEQIDSAVFEDREVAAAIDSGKMDQFAGIVARRNAAHRIWGFKRPEAYKHLEALCATCRNPRIIVPFRDILAIALRNKISMQMDALTQLPRLATQYQALLTAIDTAAVPSLLISYEKSLQFPVRAASEVASFCGITATSAAIENAVAVINNGNARYLNAARLQHQGQVGRLIQGELRGWVKGHNQSRLTVSLQLDDKVVQTMRADIYRPDVEKAGIGDGRYGFAFKITDDMDTNSIVRVRVENSKEPLKNSGLPLSKYAG